jgi:Putative peptidoglycan binding domain
LKNLRIKLLTLGVLATVVMSSTLAFAASSTVVPTKTITASNTLTAATAASYNSTNYLWEYNYYAPEGRPILYMGVNNPSLNAGLQRYLNAEGFNAGTVDGIFGAQTKAAVIRLQNCTSFKGFGLSTLSPDGQVGPYTWGKLYILNGLV